MKLRKYLLQFLTMSNNTEREATIVYKGTRMSNNNEYTYVYADVNQLDHDWNFSAPLIKKYTATIGERFTCVIAQSDKPNVLTFSKVRPLNELLPKDSTIWELLPTWKNEHKAACLKRDLIIKIKKIKVQSLEEILAEMQNQISAMYYKDRRVIIRWIIEELLKTI